MRRPLPRRTDRNPRVRGLQHDRRAEPLWRVRAGAVFVDAGRAWHPPGGAPGACAKRRLCPDLASSFVRPRALCDHSRCRGLSQQVASSMKSIFGIVLRPLVTLVTVAIAAAIGYALGDYHVKARWPRAGKVRADVVAVAPDVSGLVTEVLVHDNQRVRK